MRAQRHRRQTPMRWGFRETDGRVYIGELAEGRVAVLQEVGDVFGTWVGMVEGLDAAERFDPAAGLR